MLNAGWEANKGPTKAVIENGKLYGRGGADDGYSTYSSMLAIKTCQEQGIPIPRKLFLYNRLRHADIRRLIKRRPY
jgi:acetylornithine deacetylase/succinyl-diaminopimelate desuccinylase-like protein